VANRILIVDDNAVIRRALRNIIEFNDGWAVCGEAVDGRDAIEKAQALCPDLIVLDVSMPVLNGLGAARILHQIMPTVPVILCSLHAGDVLQREATAAGVQTVVSKAENMQILITKAKELLQTTPVSNPET
jgi:DNA-binding NarL/FixJ family response regulator